MSRRAVAGLRPPLRCGPWHSRHRSGLAVIQQDANRRCARIVELSGSNGPDERAEESGGDRAAGGNQEDDDAHDGSRRAGHRIAPELMATIVNELTGIRMAAASGVSAPASASVSPIAL